MLKRETVSHNLTFKVKAILQVQHHLTCGSNYCGWPRVTFCRAMLVGQSHQTICTNNNDKWLICSLPASATKHWGRGPSTTHTESLTLNLVSQIFDLSRGLCNHSEQKLAETASHITRKMYLLQCVKDFNEHICTPQKMYIVIGIK